MAFYLLELPAISIQHSHATWRGYRVENFPITPANLPIYFFISYQSREILIEMKG